MYSSKLCFHISTNHLVQITSTDYFINTNTMKCEEVCTLCHWKTLRNTGYHFRIKSHHWQKYCKNIELWSAWLHKSAVAANPVTWLWINGHHPVLCLMNPACLLFIPVIQPTWFPSLPKGKWWCQHFSPMCAPLWHVSLLNVPVLFSSGQRPRPQWRTLGPRIWTPEVRQACRCTRWETPASWYTPVIFFFHSCDF